MTTSNRLHIAGQTYIYLVQRRNENAGFYDNACYRFYLLHLLNCLGTFQIKLHAYVLKTDGIWFLATPGTPKAALSLIKFVNQSYSSYFNTRFDRSVKVWRDIPKSSLVQGDQLVLDCQKFIERVPLKYDSINHPGEYEWSSYCANSFGGTSRFLTHHKSFSALIKQSDSPYKRYREFIAKPFNNPYQLYLESRLISGSPVAKRKHKLVSPIAIKKSRHSSAMKFMGRLSSRKSKKLAVLVTAIATSNFNKPVL